MEINNPRLEVIGKQGKPNQEIKQQTCNKNSKYHNQDPQSFVNFSTDR